MRSKNYGINVRVTEQEKQKLLENARFCSLSLSEYLRRLGLGKEVKAAITERDYRLFRMLNGLKAELPQLQKEEILSRLEAILNELKYDGAAIYDQQARKYRFGAGRPKSGVALGYGEWDTGKACRHQIMELRRQRRPSPQHPCLRSY